MKYDIYELRQTGRQREKKSRWIERMRNNRNNKRGGERVRDGARGKEIGVRDGRVERKRKRKTQSKRKGERIILKEREKKTGE